jgi:two-component system sensor histidine kinase VicK
MSSRTSQSNPLENKRAETDYQELFQKLPYPYLIFDAQDPECRVLDVNEARARFTGVRREDLVGRSWFDVLADLSGKMGVTEIPKLRRQMLRMLRTGKLEAIPTFRSENMDQEGKVRVRYWQSDCVFIRDATGQVSRVVVTTRDVTEQRRVARRAVHTESRLEAALAIGRIGSWVWDVRSDHVVPDNSFAKLFGLSKQRVHELKMEDVLASVHPDDRARVKRAIRRSIVERLPFEEENRVTLRSGELRWVLSRGQADELDGNLTVMGVVVDITERRNLQAEVALARRQERLNRRAARMLQERNVELEAIARSKDEFVALASHQLRTPATAVKQYLGMVLQGYAGDITATQTDMLHKAFESNERQIQIINQILSAARADTGRLVMVPVAIDLRLLMQNIVSEMRPTFEQYQHHVSVKLPRNPVIIMADQGYLRMAIENILNNACGYTPAGGSISVQLARAGKQCRLTITDTGVGIRKADYGKLFAKFSRIHNPLSVQAGGSGIGLYLTAEIVRLHHGEITVESKLRKGTAFAISLPLVQNTN